MEKQTFVLSDESLNSYGFWVKTAGIDLSDFKKNPIMLYDHRSWSMMPIGKWENIRQEGDRLLADAVFDEKDETAQKVAQKVKDGFLNACSIGFEVLKTSKEALKPNQTRATVNKAKLMEVSIVPLPSNKNALKLHFAGGVTLSGDLDENVLNQKIPTINKNRTNMDKIIAHLGLKADATQEEVLEKIKQNTSAWLGEKERLTALSVEAIVGYGEEKGGVTKENRPEYEALAKADPKKVLALFQKTEKTDPVPDITQQLGQGTKTESEDRSTWTLSEWKEKDYSGLLALKKKDEKKYYQLFKK